MFTLAWVPVTWQAVFHSPGALDEVDWLKARLENLERGLRRNSNIGGGSSDREAPEEARGAGGPEGGAGGVHADAQQVAGKVHERDATGERVMAGGHKGGGSAAAVDEPGEASAAQGDALGRTADGLAGHADGQDGRSAVTSGHGEDGTAAASGLATDAEGHLLLEPLDAVRRRKHEAAAAQEAALAVQAEDSSGGHVSPASAASQQPPAASQGGASPVVPGPVLVAASGEAHRTQHTTGHGTAVP